MTLDEAKRVGKHALGLAARRKRCPPSPPNYFPTLTASHERFPIPHHLSHEATVHFFCPFFRLLAGWPGWLACVINARLLVRLNYFVILPNLLLVVTLTP